MRESSNQRWLSPWTSHVHAHAHGARGSMACMMRKCIYAAEDTKDTPHVLIHETIGARRRKVLPRYYNSCIAVDGPIERVHVE